MKIAVVIPTLNEEQRIAATVRSVATRGRPVVVVVADCGSTDDTRRIASAAGALVETGAGLDCRAAALNAGAARALRACPELEALFFLHADAVPPPGWDAALASALEDPEVVGGAFDFAWDLADARGLSRRLLVGIGAINRVRMRLTGSYYGDQGIFARASAFADVGGFPRRSLLEDVAFCRRLRRVGALRLARARLTASPRRFLHHGVARQALIDAAILAAGAVGLEPTRLHAWYNREKE